MPSKSDKRKKENAKEEWDGPKSLHDMIDWGEEDEEIKKLVQNTRYIFWIYPR